LQNFLNAPRNKHKGKQLGIVTFQLAYASCGYGTSFDTSTLLKDEW